MQTSRPFNARRIVRGAALIAFGIVVVLLAYVAVLARPEMLFTYRRDRGGVSIYSRVPLDSRIDASLDSALDRLARGPLHEAAERHRLFIAGGPRLYAFFTGPGRRAMAKNFELGNSIFLPMVDLRTASVVHFDGRREPLAAIVAHETAHTELQRAVGGVFRLWRLPFWKKEGYSEYVFYDAPLELRRGYELLRSTTTGVIERQPGMRIPAQYLQAELFWRYLLEERHMTVKQVVESSLTQRDLLDAIASQA